MAKLVIEQGVIDIPNDSAGIFYSAASVWNWLFVYVSYALIVLLLLFFFFQKKKAGHLEIVNLFLQKGVNIRDLRGVFLVACEVCIFCIYFNFCQCFSKPN